MKQKQPIIYSYVTDATLDDRGKIRFTNDPVAGVDVRYNGRPTQARVAYVRPDDAGANNPYPSCHSHADKHPFYVTMGSRSFYDPLTEALTMLWLAGLRQ